MNILLNFLISYFNQQKQMMLKESQRMSRSLSGLEEKISLINILTCKICNTKAKSANLCPNCSKFFCQNCIKTWLRANKCCPSCFVQIGQSSLVGCQKLSDDLSNALQALNQEGEIQIKKCEQHSQKVAYYCSDCRYSLCSDCIILSGKHSGHKFVKLKQAKTCFNEQILSTINRLRNYKKGVIKVRDQLYDYKAKSDENRNGRIQDMRHHTDKIGNIYEDKFAKNKTALETNLNNLKTMIAVGHKSFDHFKSLLESISKPQLVLLPKSQAEDKIQESCDQILRKNISVEPATYPLQSKIVPELTQTQFWISNYSQLRQKNQILYTQSFKNGELVWRLKIYANGIDNTDEKKQKMNSEPLSPRTRHILLKKEDYISIYIQLQSGVRNGCQFRHKIQILHPHDTSKVISQVYESKFEIGEYWGYDHFTNISALYQYGYIQPEVDTLHIKLSVAPASYYESCIDASEILRIKEQIFFENMRKIERLKEQLQKKQIQQMNSSKAQITKVSIEDLRMSPEKYPLSLPQIMITPSQRFQQSKAEENQLDFQSFIIQKEDFHALSEREDPDYQSNELRKAYKRLRRSRSKNLLLF